MYDCVSSYNVSLLNTNIIIFPLDIKHKKLQSYSKVSVTVCISYISIIYTNKYIYKNDKQIFNIQHFKQVLLECLRSQ